MNNPVRASRRANFLDPIFLTSVVLTIVFYAVLHQPKFQGTILHRYTTQHAVEYVIVGLFIWGIMDILFKFSRFPRELLALRRDWLAPRNGREPAARAKELLEQIHAQPAWAQNSRIGKRLTKALEFVVERGSASDYRDHIQYLADQDDEATHASYTLMRFVIGVTPVLGFLGTVVHFGTALSGISFDELDDRLSTVVAEMGQAFNTTTTALTAAMFTMFALFICERLERRIVQTIDRLVDRELLHRFESRDENLTPFLSVLKDATHEVHTVIAGQIHKQIEVWQQGIHALLGQFENRQQQESSSWSQTLIALDQRHQELDQQREQRLHELITLVDARQSQFLDRVQTTLGKAITLRDDFSQLVSTLQTVANGEGKLLELQTSLTNNLKVIHETQQIDDALHNLTAAIHLLTARNQHMGKSGSAAA